MATGGGCGLAIHTCESMYKKAGAGWAGGDVDDACVIVWCIFVDLALCFVYQTTGTALRASLTGRNRNVLVRAVYVCTS